MADGVAVRGVSKSFGARRVLTDVDLEIAAGTMVAVLGPSGCGKTTLLRVIAGFCEPDAGTVDVGGTTMTGVPAHRRRVGLLPQEGALLPYLSVGSNVAFGLPRASKAAVAGQVADWLAVVGLAGYADARPHELSGGQQQRVALARALAARPRVILLDEPFAALDAGLRGRVREDIAEILAAAGTTAVLVTHDQAEALSLADSVAVLMGGVVAQHGPPVAVHQRPVSLEVARFVGATVELSGDRVAGTVRSALGTHPVLGDAADGPVTVVMRPDQLRIAPEGVPARVTTSRFYGADTAVHVVVGDGSRLILRVPGGATCVRDDEVGVVVDGPVLAFARSPT